MMARKIVCLGLSFALAAWAWAVPQDAPAESIYTFENLADGQLVGQDGWGDYLQGTHMVVGSGSGINTTKVAMAGTLSGTAIVRRANDANFSFPAHSATDTSAVMQFDFQYVYHEPEFNYSYYMCLGADSTEDTDGVVSNLNERSTGFGLFWNTFFLIDLADGVTYPFKYPITAAEATNGDWIRLKHEIDFTANGGDGAGRLYYQNLTRGDTAFTEVTTTPINLSLTDMNDDVEDPSTWDTMLLIKTGTSAQMDNIIPNVEDEPALEGDLNSDGFVGGDDLDIVRSYWGQTVTSGDLLSGDPSDDGFVGGDDLDIVRANWGQGNPPAPGAVPEPSTATLLILGSLGLWLRRRA